LKNCVVILAAGDGKRMKSEKPKVLCEVLFQPMLRWVINACEKSEAGDICVVKGKRLFRREISDCYAAGTFRNRPCCHAGIGLY